jgi:hypothetical protein
MLEIKNLILDLNTDFSKKITVFKVKANTQLNLEIKGSFRGPKNYEYIFPVSLLGPFSAIKINGKFFVSEGSKLKLIFSVTDTLKTKAAAIDLNLKGLIFDKTSSVIVGQKISLSHKDSRLKHSLAFGGLNPDILSYLNSRGITNNWLKGYLEKNYVNTNV